MSKRTFLIAVVLLVLILVVINLPEAKAAAAKLAGSGGTDASGAAGSAAMGKILGTTKPAAAAGTAGLNYDKVLSKGVSGSEVLMLQQVLNKVNSIKRGMAAPLVEDGKFGDKTAAMLKFYANTTTITLNLAIAAYNKAVGL